VKWPPEVEVVASVFRAAGTDARLEQLPAGETAPPGLGVRVDAYDCQGRLLVALVPDDRDLDPRKLVAAARCAYARPVAAPLFPFSQATVLAERLLLKEGTVWLPAGSPGHVVGVSPAELVRLTHAQTVDLVAEV
jgi:prolyl-tRNA editing enzyme YbaK/EbsC (Cys-tRNA(Pro) deacylase)